MAFRKGSSRILILSIGTLSLLILGILGYTSYRISDVKGPLINLLRDHIDGELKIESARVVFFPVGINLNDVRLFAPGEDRPSATIRKAKLRFKIIPLIQKKIETDLTVIDPEIFFRTNKRGSSNMERIFAPSIAGKKRDEASKIDQFWWKRIAVNRLTIKNASFKSTQEGSDSVTELKNIGVKADRIRFDSNQKPAEIEISYLLPKISKEPMTLKTRLEFQEKDQAMSLKEGEFLWGPLKFQITGAAFLPGKTHGEVTLDLKFQGQKLSLNDFNKILEDPLPLSGTGSFYGTVRGSPYSPILTLIFDSSALKVKDVSLNQIHSEIIKKGKPIIIKNASMGVYEGTVNVSGEVLNGKENFAKFKIKMQNLSLAAASRKEDVTARLSGNLNLKSRELQNPLAYSGGGHITVGPFPLPKIDLKNKVRVAEILSAGTSLGKMVNVGMLSNSSNVIGTQINQVKATVEIAGGNLTLKPFSMANGHFNAQGNARIIQQKNIQGGGTFNLNHRVTAALIPDRLLRQTLTNGRGSLSFPFSIKGPLRDPDVQVDSGHLKGQMAKATLIMLQKQALTGVNPNEMLGAALKGTPAGDPNHPLGQILGTAVGQPNRTQQQSTNRSKTSQTQGSRKPSTGNSIADQLLFGN